MRSLLQLKKEYKLKTKIIERIKYFDELLDNFMIIEDENLKKQTRINNLKRVCESLEDVAKKEESENKDLMHNFEKLFKEFENMKSQLIDLNEKCVVILNGYAEKTNKNVLNSNEIEKLKETIEFLKNNKRAPNLEELKDYQYKRKRSVKK